MTNGLPNRTETSRKRPSGRMWMPACPGRLYLEQFVRELEKKGYSLCLQGKYFTLKPPGRDRPVRFKTLGEHYTPEAIRRRILEPKPFLPAGKKSRRRKLRTGGKSLRKLTGLRALYVSYLYKMGALPRKPSRSSFAVREDIRRLDKRIAQMQFLSKHRIDNREQLAALEKEAEVQISALLRNAGCCINKNKSTRILQF